MELRKNYPQKNVIFRVACFLLAALAGVAAFVIGKYHADAPQGGLTLGNDDACAVPGSDTVQNARENKNALLFISCGGFLE